MNISQLIRIATYISGSIAENGISEQYQRLLGLCEQALKGDTAVGNDLVEHEFNLLIGRLEQVDPTSWDTSHLKIFEKLEDPSLLGAAASKRLRLLFEQCNGDYLRLIQEFGNDCKRIDALQKQLKQLKGSLEPLVNPSEEAGGSLEMEERSHLLQIYFEEAVFIKDINQLEKFCRIWNSILTGFTTLTHEDTKEIRIYDIESSSITFYAGIKTLNALSRGIYQVLCEYEHILKIKPIQTEIAKLELKNGEEIINLLEEEIIHVVDTAASAVTVKLIEKYEWNEDEGDGVAVYGMVQTALKQMLNFVERGGRIYTHHSSDLRALNERVISMLS